MPVHIEGFGSLETIAKTKGEIFERLPASGLAIINLDDQFYSQWQQQAGGAEVKTFSKSNAAADFYASNIQLHSTGITSFNLHMRSESIIINLDLLGEHNIVNALAASAAAVAAGASLEQLKRGLEKVQPVSGRLKTIVRTGQTVIDDTYNASPGSVKAAIDVLAGFKGVRCLVLGTMGELGEIASSSHREVALYAREKGIEQLVVVGEYAELAVEAFGDGGCAYAEMNQLLLEFDVLTSASVILIKGSRSARMEQVVDALLIAKEGEQ
jgi:UDP-N-acetylmuramoyl-tripeptide--D-alanyl-D-alanine ligase